MFAPYLSAVGAPRSVAQERCRLHTVHAVPTPPPPVLLPKSCRWKGLPAGAARSGLGALQREKHDRERSLDKKKEQLAELLVQQIAFRNLARRNRLNSTATSAAVAEGGADGGGLGCEAEQDADDLAASKVGLVKGVGVGVLSAYIMSHRLWVVCVGRCYRLDRARKSNSVRKPCLVVAGESGHKLGIVVFSQSIGRPLACFLIDWTPSFVGNKCKLLGHICGGIVQSSISGFLSTLLLCACVRRQQRAAPCVSLGHELQAC